MQAPEYTIKHNLVIIHRRSAWMGLQDRLLKEHGDSIMISWVCRRKLGFSVRQHNAWIPIKRQVERYRLEEQTHLDFYDSAAMSWFLLRYL